MRDLKFRAWNETEHGNEMVYESQMLRAGDILKRFGTVMQYTGLKDKNDQDIYEFDWVKVKDFLPIHQGGEETFDDIEGEIRFVNGCFEVCDLYPNGLDVPLYACIESEIEITGNKFENVIK